MNSLEKLYKSIEESKLYKDYKKISTILEEDDSIQKLINEIKDLEKEATLLEYKGDIKYKEIDKIIDDAFNKINPTSNKEMGLIMREVTPLLKGKADMKLVSDKIKERVSKL